MPKTAGKGKSSATPATRKKNERAALKKQGIDPDTVGKGKGAKGGPQQQRVQKKKKNQKKIFVPPPKPPPPPPDPLDDMGLASLLPAGLVVLLRRASKKDVITRTRACEALLSWVRGSDEEGITASDDERREAEVTWLPCWAHLFPRLSISPTRRLRSLAASIHAVLLTQGHTRAEMLNTPAYVESTLGPLVVLAHDTDRGVARGAKTALEGFVQWTTATADQRLDAREQLYTLLPHLRLLLLSPSPAAALRETAPAANSSNASGSGTPVPHAPVRFDSGLARDAKARDDANVEEDIRATDGRLAAGAAGALAWVVSSHPAPLPMEQFEELLTSAEMWSLLTPPDIVKLELPAPPVPAPEAVKAKRSKKRPPSPPPPPPLPPIGSETPLARARAWSLVSSLVSSGTPALLDAALPVFAPLAMPAFWAERDATDPANVPLRARAALEPAQPFSGAVRRLAAFSEDLCLVKTILARSRTSLHALAKQGTSSLALSRAVRTLAAIGASGAPNGLDNAVRELVLDSTGTAANVLCASTEEASIAPLVSLIGSLLHTFPEAHVNAEEGIANALASAARNVLPQALRDAHVPGAAAANFYASYLPLVQDGNERGEVWTNALESISSPAGLDAEALEALFSAAETLSASLLSEENVTSARLDEQVLTLGTAVFNGTEQPSGSERAVLSRLLDRPLPFVTQATSNALLGLLVQALGSHSTNEESKRHASTLLALLEAWCTTRERLQKLVSDPTLRPASAAVFCLAHLEPSPEYGTAATRLWNALAAEPTAGVAAVALLRERILQPGTSLRALLRAGEALPPTADGSSLLLSEAELASFFTEACASRPRSELAVLDPLVPYGNADDINSKAATEGKQEYDAAGLSTYARAVAVMIQVLSKAGKGARATPWALPHLILFAIAAEDATSLHAASPFFFAPGAHTQALAKYATDAVSVATAMISGLAGDLDDHWHLGTTDALRKPSAATKGLAAALHSLWYRNESQAARVLSRLLAGILSFSAATEAAGIAWLRLAQGATDSKHSSAAAVLKVVKPLVLSSPVYERVRNELAARLAGIPPTRVEKEGLPLLRLLLAAAPPEDAPVALVPQQRAIFLLQAVQKWYASDEAELGEESFVRLSQIFSELLPIVDNMPGSHLELILDVLEAQLEAGGWTADGLPTTQAALRLLEQVQQRAARAQALREVWNARQAEVLSMLRPLFLDQPLESGINVPLSETTALLARLVRRLPDSAFKQEGDETRLTTLLQAPDGRVQLTAYRRLATFVRSRVSDLVVEAAVDPTHAGKAAALSVQLTQQCSSAPGAGLPIADIGRYAEEAMEEPQTTLAFFLSWLALFEHFEEASLALKSAFAAQIEQMELLSNGFLPTTFGLMLRKDSTGRPWDPRGWALDEVFLDDVDPYAPGTLQLLAGHLFHRALGHLAVGVRNYVMSMRDRALSSSITSLTTRHFSPVLAGAELAHLRSGDARSTLEGEGLSIKITTANEVVATYTVDEQDMQIGVSFPNDFPLHGVEVRDIKRVGVSEARWRSWLLATQQLLTGKNGLVFDALLLFKRNAEAMFAGYEGSECAICYSIIGGESGSLMLPTKKCATCKKPFHSSCLLRWSLTSGSSTCPMCRSIL
ncbi:Predicted E3 ubiquitin ligase [Ceraceosorus bombacis]|uniref:E3 ubiquitin-protein ligase listerin n=1 Tax=Ceraceosorus bombacis TaxID=401625 RepID=A0A0P1BPG6_9BASI|nr:Predicted E3 ubiquitin ligase [Ceraceosorus bombacis]